MKLFFLIVVPVFSTHQFKQDDFRKTYVCSAILHEWDRWRPCNKLPEVMKSFRLCRWEYFRNSKRRVELCGSVTRWLGGRVRSCKKRHPEMLAELQQAERELCDFYSREMTRIDYIFVFIVGVICLCIIFFLLNF